ncbi:MAG TPA: hypothetical protein VGP26_10595 [Actinophytocola sp.]|jgi:hypothetical protein|nr:hypothetical protein [Actinophytocola sp.]
MEVNISGAALVRLALWVALAAVVVGILIGGQSHEATSPTPAPTTAGHPAAPPAVEAANDR